MIAVLFCEWRYVMVLLLLLLHCRLKIESIEIQQSENEVWINVLNVSAKQENHHTLLRFIVHVIQIENERYCLE